jgi:dolichol-phosphate mannosyltransferase
MKIGIVIPTKNEQDNIKNLYKSINKNLKKNQFTICFVDKSDNQETIDQIKKYFFKTNYHIIKEKGDSSKFTTRCVASHLGFKWLLKKTKSNFFVDLDADLAQDPKEINIGIKLLLKNKSDVIIASKYLKRSKVKGRSFLRLFISCICGKICQIIISNNIYDFSNSFRIYRKNALKLLIKRDVLYKSPIQHLENLIILIKAKAKITEMPTNYIERVRGESSIKVVGLFFYGLEFIHCLLRYIFKS